MQRYDVIVLGTGAAGLVAAIAAHEAGARVLDQTYVASGRHAARQG